MLLGAKPADGGALEVAKKNSPMSARLQGSKKKISVAAADLTRSVETPTAGLPAESETSSATAQTPNYGAKEEIRDAIDAAERSMSKCYATLRRLRTKLKN